MTHERHTQQGLPDLKLHEPSLGRARVVRQFRVLLVLIVLVLLLGLARTLWTRGSEATMLGARSRETAVLHVLVISPSGGGAGQPLTLPGTLQGRVEAQIYARTSGYVKAWFKDIGAAVRKGDLLAVLDIPEVNRQVDEAAANYELARIAFERWTRLRAQDAVAQQELDEKTGAFRQAEAVLKRLREQLAYGRVLAPFDGVVTRRNLNVGDLVNAGGAATPALFTISQVHQLHLYLYVPQDRAAQVRVGDPVDVVALDRPERHIAARVARTAGAIDQGTGTLQIDVELANADRALLPGSSVQALLRLRPTDRWLLPTNTLLFGAAGSQVALVRDGHVLRQAVELGTDYGRLVEVRSGLAAQDRVIVNPPDSVVSGQAVVIEPPAPAASAASAR